jgi:hypothetical protein
MIEPKVSRDRNSTSGQLLYYMEWGDMNLAGFRRHRGIIVAKEISVGLLP